jgi:hypothetical protein
MVKFKTVVKRSEWLRERGEGYLLDEEGMKCCLGFRCEQAGIPKKNILDKDMPASVVGKRAKLPKWLCQRFGDEAGRAAQINDDTKINDIVREAQLKNLFAEQGEEIEFID